MTLMIRYGNKTHICGYPSEPNSIWQVFPALTGFGYEFEFSSISKYRYRTGNRDICTHTQTRPECTKSIYYPFYINRNTNPKSFHSHVESLRRSESQSFKWHSIIIVLSFLLSYLTLSASLFTITIVIDHHHLFDR